MSWVRFDDHYTEWKCWDGVSLDARWHYHALVERISRGERFDGVLSRVAAQRASDISDPDAAMQELATIGLLEVGEATVRVVKADDHLPPPSVRQKSTARVQRFRRKEKCQYGNHSSCSTGDCEVVAAGEQATHFETRYETGSSGTGRDRTGQDSAYEGDHLTNWMLTTQATTGREASRLGGQASRWLNPEAECPRKAQIRALAPMQRTNSGNWRQRPPMHGTSPYVN